MVTKKHQHKWEEYNLVEGKPTVIKCLSCGKTSYPNKTSISRIKHKGCIGKTRNTPEDGWDYGVKIKKNKSVEKDIIIKALVLGIGTKT